METVKFPCASVVPVPIWAPMMPLLMAYAVTVAPLTGPFTAVPVITPSTLDVAPPLSPPPREIYVSMPSAARSIRSGNDRYTAVLARCRLTFKHLRLTSSGSRGNAPYPRPQSFPAPSTLFLIHDHFSFCFHGALYCNWYASGRHTADCKDNYSY